MDTATLDRLLMDRTLGGLSPDVERLLDAYLAAHAEHAQHAAAYAETARVVRLALGAASDEALPPFPRARIAKLERRRAQLRWLRDGAAAAALLVIGVGVGSFLPRAVQTSAEVREVAVPRAMLAAEPLQASDDAAADDDGIWSVARWRAAAERAADTPEPRRMRVRDSIFGRPETGDAS